MPILQIRDKDGKFVAIPAIKGDEGKSAYEQAKEGGYKGTEKEFIAILNGLTFPENILKGTYTGNGEESQFIDLKATPKAVLVMDCYGEMVMNYDNDYYLWGGLALEGFPCLSGYSASRENDEKSVEVCNGGFNVFCKHLIRDNSDHFYVQTNYDSWLYYYIAFI